MIFPGVALYFQNSALLNWESVVKINMQVNQPTAEQIKAIITWADRMGRFWRRELHSAWMDGNYQGNRDISSGLQQVRNEFGPEWLVKFNLKAAKAAQAAPEPVLEQITGPVEPCPVSDRELAAYQPKIVLDAITNALQKPAASAPAASQSSGASARAGTARALSPATRTWSVTPPEPKLVPLATLSSSVN